MHPVGFEPTPPKRIELESIALDHSATDACISAGICSTSAGKIFIFVATAVSKPPARFELATFCLRNRCTNHCAMVAILLQRDITSRVPYHMSASTAHQLQRYVFRRRRRTESPYHFSRFNYFIGIYIQSLLLKLTSRICFGGGSVVCIAGVAASTSHQPSQDDSRRSLHPEFASAAASLHPHRTNRRNFHPEVSHFRGCGISIHRAPVESVMFVGLGVIYDTYASDVMQYTVISK